MRGLDPPEPFVRVARGLADNPKQPLRILIHREPFPLYDLIEEQGYGYRTRAVEGGFEILIEPSR